MRELLAFNLESNNDDKIHPILLKTTESIGLSWWLYLFVVPFDIISIVLLSLLMVVFFLTASIQIGISMILIIYLLRYTMRDSNSINVNLIYIVFPMLIVVALDHSPFLIVFSFDQSISNGVFILLLDFLFIYFFRHVIHGSKSDLSLNIVPVMIVIWLLKGFNILLIQIIVVFSIFNIIVLVINSPLDLLLKIVPALITIRLFTSLKLIDKWNNEVL